MGTCAHARSIFRLMKHASNCMQQVGVHACERASKHARQLHACQCARGCAAQTSNELAWSCMCGSSLCARRHVRQQPVCEEACAAAACVQGGM
eukprot:351204-Chlamydomonas_euryale.AAC.10